jgi:hypothetical protein
LCSTDCTCSDDASAEASEALRRSGDKLTTNAGAAQSADNSNSDQQQQQQQQAVVTTENMTQEVQICYKAMSLYTLVSRARYAGNM